MQRAIRGERGADVPCGGCTACCTSSQFVHIAPEETDTLARIPAELLFPAPLAPRGHVVMGYDERGHCPMLIDGRCSIYDHRPRTCRTYDCRIFAATGIAIDDEDKVLINQRVRQWRFALSTDADHARQDAVRAAARWLEDNAPLLPPTAGSLTATRRAVLAIELHVLFLSLDEETGRPRVIEPDPDVMRVEVMCRMAAGGELSGPAAERAANVPRTERKDRTS
jgi:Fe-S-cluster containining protein